MGGGKREGGFAISEKCDFSRELNFENLRKFGKIYEYFFPRKYIPVRYMGYQDC